MSFSTTLRNWSDSVLQLRNQTVSNFPDDFKSGVLFIELFQEVSGAEIDNWFCNPSTIEEKKANISFIIRELLMDTAEILLDPEDIVNGDFEQIQHTLWCIASKYLLRELSFHNLNGIQAVKHWVYHILEPVGLEPFTNTEEEWKDGRRFAALLGELRPKLLDYDLHPHGDSQQSLQIVFSKAETAGIPKILDVQEMMSGNMSMNSIYLYLALWMKKFGKSQREMKESNSFHDMRTKWESTANQVKNSLEQMNEWIDSKTSDAIMKQLDHRTIDDILDKIEAVKAEDIPLKKYYIQWLDSKVSELDTKAQNIGIGRYVPPEKLTLPLLLRVYYKVEEKITRFENVIREERARFLFPSLTTSIISSVRTLHKSGVIK
eukprot:gb/GECH01012698.1/.p1 GENE.gb/GECH01012698.1/~~gb/GECH01012698.1/.p1  ORF type:complete len:376 (+),score=74.27 gb/GECH01012698.1/:1-1128(+)